MIIEINWDIFMSPIIKLSVLKPSIIILITEYNNKYTIVNCPANFLWFFRYINIKNIIKVTRNGNVKQAIKNLTKTIKILENKLITLETIKSVSHE